MCGVAKPDHGPAPILAANRADEHVHRAGTLVDDGRINLVDRKGLCTDIEQSDDVAHGRQPSRAGGGAGSRLRRARTIRGLFGLLGGSKYV